MEKQLGKCQVDQIKPLAQLKLADLHPRFIVTAFNLSSQRTHFIKKWDHRDKLYNLIDVILVSIISRLLFRQNQCSRIWMIRLSSK